MIPVRTNVFMLSFVCLAVFSLASAWQEVAEFLSLLRMGDSL